jgi:hypothetical protein
MRTSNKEKDNTIIRLKSRLQDLEEAFENAYKLSDDKEARLKQENKMFQDVSDTDNSVLWLAKSRFRFCSLTSCYDIFHVCFRFT